MRKYKGFKIMVNNTIKYCRPMRKQKIIEYNTHFWHDLTFDQRKFMLEWCYREYKCRDVFKADKQTLRWFLANVNDSRDPIIQLYTRLNFRNREHKQRRLIGIALQNSADRFNEKYIIPKIRWWNRIINFLKIPAYGNSED